MKIINQFNFTLAIAFYPENPGQVYSINTDAVYPYKPYPRLGHFGEGNKNQDFPKYPIFFSNNIHPLIQSEPSDNHFKIITKPLPQVLSILASAVQHCQSNSNR